MFKNSVLKSTQGEIVLCSPETTKETTGFHMMQPLPNRSSNQVDAINLFVDRDAVGLGNNRACTSLYFYSCSKWSSPK